MCKIINRKVTVTKNGDKFVATEDIENFKVEADTFEEIKDAATILAEIEFIDFVNPDGTPFIEPKSEAKPETKEN